MKDELSKEMNEEGGDDRKDDWSKKRRWSKRSINRKNEEEGEEVKG